MNLKFWKKNKPAGGKKKPFREWLDAILFAIAVATFVRWFLIEPSVVSSPSMEGSLLAGDFLFISKWHYGTRTPATPLQLPLTHQKLWGTEIPAYLDWIQWPVYRLPGFSKIKNNDVVVFNYPPDEEHPVDLRPLHIKRCIGTPGDVVKIDNMQVYVNDKLLPNPPGLQFQYYLYCKDSISPTVFQQLGIVDYSQPVPDGYVVYANPAVIRQLSKLPQVKDIIMYKGIGQDQVFPFSALHEWDLDNYGPLTVPARGMTLRIDSLSLPLYEKIIVRYEDNQGVELLNNRLYIGGKAVENYTFKKDYYFMMDDNRHLLEDSRSWGFVPQDHIVGKAVMICWSVDPDSETGNIFQRIRWNRIGNIIE